LLLQKVTGKIRDHLDNDIMELIIPQLRVETTLDAFAKDWQEWDSIDEDQIEEIRGWNGFNTFNGYHYMIKMDTEGSLMVHFNLEEVFDYINDNKLYGNTWIRYLKSEFTIEVNGSDQNYTFWELLYPDNSCESYIFSGGNNETKKLCTGDDLKLVNDIRYDGEFVDYQENQEALVKVNDFNKAEWYRNIKSFDFINDSETY